MNLLSKTALLLKKIRLYIRETHLELKKSSWPDPRSELLHSMGAVLFGAALFALAVFIADFALFNGVKLLSTLVR